MSDKTKIVNVKDFYGCEFACHGFYCECKRTFRGEIFYFVCGRILPCGNSCFIFASANVDVAMDELDRLNALLSESEGLVEPDFLSACSDCREVEHCD